MFLFFISLNPSLTFSFFLSFSLLYFFGNLCLIYPSQFSLIASLNQSELSSGYWPIAEEVFIPFCLQSHGQLPWSYCISGLFTRFLWSLIHEVVSSSTLKCHISWGYTIWLTLAAWHHCYLLLSNKLCWTKKVIPKNMFKSNLYLITNQKPAVILLIVADFFISLM